MLAWTCGDSGHGESVGNKTKADTPRGNVAEKLEAADREILAVGERTVSAHEEEASGLTRQLEALRSEILNTF